MIENGGLGLGLGLGLWRNTEAAAEEAQKDDWELG